MMPSRLSSFVLAAQLAALGAMRVHAQHVGDTIVVVATGARVRIGDREVGSAPRGAQLIVREVRGDLVRVFCEGEAIRIDAHYVIAYSNRGNAWWRKKEYGKAIADYKEAIRLRPNYDKAHVALAWLRATCPDDRFRDGGEAVWHARLACELVGWKSPTYLETLAAAFAESSQFADAVKWQHKAVDGAPEDEKKRYRERLELYRAKKPYREE